MELIKVTIKNFLSIKEEETIKINNTITSIVGLNESGKTTLLKAIEKLNGEKIQKNEKNKKCKNQDSYIIGRFLMEKDEIEKINKKSKSNILKLPNETLYVDITIEDEKDTQYYELYKKVNNDAESIEPNEFIIDNCIRYLESKGIEISEELIGDIKNNSIEEIKPKLVEVLQDYKNQEYYDEINNVINDLNEDDWIKLIPKFKIVKFSSSTDILKDEVDISEIADNIQVNNLLKIAKIDTQSLIESVKNDDNEDLTSYEGIYKDSITKRFIEIFRQNDKDFSFKIRIDTKNNKIVFMTTDKTSGNVPISLKNRSDGFKWYFSIYITLYEYLQRNDDIKYILLFDEPNLYLNPSAQNDLLERVFKKEFKNEQIIYTTHSPYMIDASNSSSIRIVEKDDQTHLYSTTVEYWKKSTKNKKTNKNEVDPLTPVLTALNLDISNKLILDRNKKAVIVEGIEDVYILNAMIKKCGLVDNFELVNFIPCFGASKVSTMYGYLYGMGYDTYVLVDNDEDGLKALKDIVGKEEKDSILYKTLLTYNIKIDKKKKVLLESLFTNEDRNKYLMPKNTVLYRNFYDKVEELDLEKKTINNFSDLLKNIINVINCN